MSIESKWKCEVVIRKCKFTFGEVTKLSRKNLSERLEPREKQLAAKATGASSAYVRTASFVIRLLTSVRFTAGFPVKPN